MRIVFLGTGEIGAPSLRHLVKNTPHEVCAVYTQPDRPAGRDLKLRPSPIKEVALELGLPVFQPPKIRVEESVRELAELAPEVIVVVAYGQILPSSILTIPRWGCLNIHASLLPRHRGASPINSAILDGDAETGITIMQMDVGLDTGDMLRKVVTPIDSEETAGELHDRLARLAPAALEEVLADIGTERLRPEKQDDALATYAPKLTRQDGEIDWTSSARDIARKFRGLTPWPGVFTYLPGKKPLTLKVHAVTVLSGGVGRPGEVLPGGEGMLRVGTGDGVLGISQLQAAGGKRLGAEDFLRGQPGLVGQVLGQKPVQ